MKNTVSLKKNHEFRRLYRSGKSVVCPYFVIYCRQNRRKINRLGITTGTKIGNAVKRNRIRRRIREIYRTNEDSFVQGYDIVVVARTRGVHSHYGKMEKEFLHLMKKLSLTKGEKQQ